MASYKPRPAKHVSKHNVTSGPIVGTEAMLTRLRVRGHEQRKLEERLNEIRLFDVDPEADPDDRIDDKTKSVVHAGGRTKRRYNEHIAITVILEHRDQYVRCQIEKKMAVDAMKAALELLQNGTPEQMGSRVNAIKEVMRATGNLVRMQNIGIQHLDAIQTCVRDTMGAVHRQTVLECSAVLEDVRRLRAQHARGQSITGGPQPSARDLLIVAGAGDDLAETQTEDQPDEPTTEETTE